MNADNIKRIERFAAHIAKTIDFSELNELSSYYQQTITELEEQVEYYKARLAVIDKALETLNQD